MRVVTRNQLVVAAEHLEVARVADIDDLDALGRVGEIGVVADDRHVVDLVDDAHASEDG